VQGGDRTTGFCAQGTSGGGAAITYALAQYGLSNYFDYVVIAAGPGVARMDYDCDKSLYTGPALDVCPLITSAPFTYFPGAKVNLWENTNTCNTKSPPQADINKWAADSGEQQHRPGKILDRKSSAQKQSTGRQLLLGSLHRGSGLAGLQRVQYDPSGGALAVRCQPSLTLLGVLEKREPSARVRRNIIAGSLHPL